MHDLTGTYPEDVYGPQGVQYYGDGNAYDNESMAIIQSVRGKPKARVKIYRAVPKVMSKQEKIFDIEQRKKAYQRRHRLPRDSKGFTDGGQYYEYLCDELDKLNAAPDEPPVAKMKIEPGNWVTISRLYARDHGEAALNGEYRIITKTVSAGELFTDGNSLHEQGYDPF